MAIDAVTVSISSGLNSEGMADGVRPAALGTAQAVMSIIGWSAGYGAGNLIAEFDHWVAFDLLAAIGGRMIWESCTREETERVLEMLHAPRLLLLAIANSLGALAVGWDYRF